MENPIKMDDLGVPLLLETPNSIFAQAVTSRSPQMFFFSIAFKGDSLQKVEVFAEK